MKNIKKLLSGSIILSLILSILAGCTNESADSASKKSTEAVSAATEETTYPELKIEITSDEERIYENMDYVFIPDDEVLGKWNAVDLVQNIDDFDPNKSSENELWFESIEFFDDGTATFIFGGNSDTCPWTKGYLIWSGWQVIPAYTIKEINGTNYLFIEWKSGDYYIRRENPRYYVFKKTSDSEPPKYVRSTLNPFDDVRHIPEYGQTGDLSHLDLTDFGKNILTLWFNEKTIFPSKDKMPADEKFQPEYILEAGKNPGLGVRALHEQGITGKGVNVAIIDQPMFIDHPEYKDKITEYTNMDESETSMHGPGVTSLLVGENIGTAPGAKVYYYAAEFIKDGDKWDATAYATALDMIVEKNENLPSGEKIKVVSISAAPTPLNGSMWINGEKYLASVKKAQEAGILVLDCSDEFGIIGACGYDFDSPEDVTLCRPGFMNNQGWSIPGHILAPIWYRTTAEQYYEGDFSYFYSGNSGLSWAIPYAAGVLAMGWQVKPELTADEIVLILRDTAYVGSDGNKYIYPTAFIKYLQNN